MLRFVAVVVVWLTLCAVVHAQYVPIPNEQSGTECPNNIDECSGFKIRTDINNKFSLMGANDCQWTPVGFQCTKINGAAIATGFATGLTAQNAIPIQQTAPANGQCLKYQASSNSFVFGACGSSTATGLVFGTTTLNTSTTAPTNGQCLQSNGTQIVGGTCGSAPVAPQFVDFSVLPGCTTTPAMYDVTHVPGGSCRQNWPVVGGGAPWIAVAVAIPPSGGSNPSVHGSNGAIASDHNAQSLSVPAPTNSNGDYMLLFVASFANGVDVPTPSTWNFVNRQTLSAFGASMELSVFSKTAASEQPSYTVGTSGTFNLSAVDYAISASSSATDAVVFATGNSNAPTVPATGSLSSTKDLLLGVYELTTPGFNEAGSLTQDQYFPATPGSGTQTSGGWGIWSGNLGLTGNSSAPQMGNLQVGGTQTCVLYCPGNGQYVETGY